MFVELLLLNYGVDQVNYNGGSDWGLSDIILDATFLPSMKTVGCS